MDFQGTGVAALSEIQDGFAGIDPTEVDTLLTAITSARRIAVYGVGREGLMIKAFAMRLYHLGLDVHVVGDMTTPPLDKGDLLIVSAGPGMFSTVAGLVGVAKKAGAAIASFTAQPAGIVPQMCDTVLVLPAQTMADDRGGSSVLPMGSLYEGVQFLAGEVLILMLAERLGVDAAAMRANHTNLE